MSVGPDSSQNPQPSSGRIAREVSNAASLELVVDYPELIVFSSQLAYGSVGLNSAELIYQTYRMRTAKIPTILLSVLPHYRSVHHVDIPAEWIRHTLHDLDAADALNDLRALATGYLAHPAQAEAIADAIQHMDALKKLPLVVDPTLGDVEVGFYTDPALVTALQNTLIPQATGLVPNLFELSQLSGVPLENLGTAEDIEAAARGLLAGKLEWVAVTGLRFTAQPILSIMLITHTSAELFSHVFLEHRSKGVGDAYTALLVSELVAGRSIADAIPRANTAIVKHIQQLSSDR